MTRRRSDIKKTQQKQNSPCIIIKKTKLHGADNHGLARGILTIRFHTILGCKKIGAPPIQIEKKWPDDLKEVNLNNISLRSKSNIVWGVNF